MRRLTATLISCAGVAILGTSTAAPAGAAPTEQCPLAVSFYCQLLIAPTLDGDIDLTQPPPPADQLPPTVPE